MGKLYIVLFIFLITSSSSYLSLAQNGILLYGWTSQNIQTIKNNNVEKVLIDKGKRHKIKCSYNKKGLPIKYKYRDRGWIVHKKFKYLNDSILYKHKEQNYDLFYERPFIHFAIINELIITDSLRKRIDIIRKSEKKNQRKNFTIAYYNNSGNLYKKVVSERFKHFSYIDSLVIHYDINEKMVFSEYKYFNCLDNSATISCNTLNFYQKTFYYYDSLGYMVLKEQFDSDLYIERFEHDYLDSSIYPIDSTINRLIIINLTYNEERLLVKETHRVINLDGNKIRNSINKISIQNPMRLKFDENFEEDNLTIIYEYFPNGLLSKILSINSDEDPAVEEICHYKYFK